MVARTPLLWLVAYGALAAASAAWSELPSLTLFRSAQIIIFLLLVVDALAGFRSLRDIFKYQLCYAAVVSIFAQFVAVLRGASFGGLHSSEVPGAIVGVAFIGAFVAGRPWRLLYAIVLLAIVLGTSTATFFAAVCGLAVMLVLSRGRREAFGWLLASLLVLVAIFAPDYLWQGLFHDKTESNIYSASGRIPVWQWTLDIVMRERPFLGLGFGYGEALARLHNERGFRMMHMHSAALSAVSNLGLMGLALLAGFWATVFRQALRTSRKGFRPVLLASISAVAVNSLAMESITAPLSTAWIAHLLLYGIGSWIICSDEHASRWFRIYSVHKTGPTQQVLRRNPL